jgi:hypothetical protein
MEENITIRIRIEVEGSPETKIKVESVTIENIKINAIVVDETN